MAECITFMKTWQMQRRLSPVNCLRNDPKMTKMDRWLQSPLQTKSFAREQRQVGVRRSRRCSAREAVSTLSDPKGETTSAKRLVGSRPVSPCGLLLLHRKAPKKAPRKRGRGGGTRYRFACCHGCRKPVLRLPSPAWRALHRAAVGPYPPPR